MFSSPRHEADGVDGEVELGDGADEHGAVLLRLALPVEHDRHSLLLQGTQITETQVAPSWELYLVANLSAKGGLVDPALVVDAALLELLEGVVQPVVEAGGLAVLQLPDEDVLEAASRGVSSE